MNFVYYKNFYLYMNITELYTHSLSQKSSPCKSQGVNAACLNLHDSTPYNKHNSAINAIYRVHKNNEQI